MKSSKVFNNISDELKKEIPKLAPGQIVTFRMLNGVPNPDPDLSEREKNPMLYGKAQINTNTRIYDKYKSDYVDIGCVDSWQGEQPLRFRLLVPGMGEYSRFQGKFSLTGGIAKDEELYEFLFLSPERKGSPCADGGIEPLYEIVDLKADIKSSVTKYDILKKSIKYSDEVLADEEKARAIMASLNQPSYQDKEILMAKIGEMARTNPEDFVKTFESKQTSLIGVLSKAVEEKVIIHDLATGVVKMGAVAIATMQIDSADDFVKQFASWIETSTNGQDVLNNIKSRMAKKGSVKQ